MLASYARRTHRLANQQLQVAFALGGEAGASLLAIMGMAVSPDTLLRLTPRVLGVDDWSKRKGQSYGIIDLLPERSAESLSTWLKAHTGVEVISRDRGTEYIKGVPRMLFRWLLSNLKDTLKRMLEGKRACLKASAESEMTESEDSGYCTQEEVNPIMLIITISLRLNHQTNRSRGCNNSSINFRGFCPKTQQLTKAEQEKLVRHERRQDQQGLSIRRIARRLTTVRKYIEAETRRDYPWKQTGSLHPSALGRGVPQCKPDMA